MCVHIHACARTNVCVCVGQYSLACPEPQPRTYDVPDHLYLVAYIYSMYNTNQACHPPTMHPCRDRKQYILCAAATTTRCMYIPPQTSSATTMTFASTHIVPPKPPPSPWQQCMCATCSGQRTPSGLHKYIHTQHASTQPHATVNKQRCQLRHHVYMQMRA